MDIKRLEINKKHLVQVPKNVKIFYCGKKNLLLVRGSLREKALKMKVRVFFVHSKNVVAVTNLSTTEKLNTRFKLPKAFQGTVTAKVKHTLIEVNHVLYQKLKLVGVGYKAFLVETITNRLFLRLGYSHPIFLNSSNLIGVSVVKFTSIFLSGACGLEGLTQTAFAIQRFKRPEPYKGKGILLSDQAFNLKKGKKI